MVFVAAAAGCAQRARRTADRMASGTGRLEARTFTFVGSYRP
jgi:hypothetical protein